MTVPRREDWQARLNAVILRHDAMPFIWGTSDCLMFVADAVEAITGRTFARPVYATAAEAQRVLAGLGAASPHDVLGLHFEAIPPAMAGTGDVGALVDEHGRNVGGICVGSMVCVKAEFGLARVERSQMVQAFRI